jgi:hypothetical protein
MYVRPYEALEQLGNEIVYIDEMSGETRTGLVVGKERIGEKAVMVFIASPYDNENDKQEGMIRYRDIFMFDDLPNDINGWGRDPVLKEYGKYIGVE